MNHLTTHPWLRLRCLPVACIVWALFYPALWSEAAPQASRKVLPNGMVWLHIEQRQLPLVAVFLTMQAGASAELPDAAGLANLTAQLLTEGTQTRSAVELHQAIDALGGRLGFEADRDTMTGHLTVLRADLEAGVRLLAEMLLQPTFPPDEFARQVQENIGQFTRLLQNPATQAGMVFRQTLYGEHPYGRPVIGPPETLQALTREDVVRFHQDYYKPEGAIVVVAGDVDQATAEALLLDVFGRWAGSPRPLPAYPEPDFPATLQVAKIPRQVAQAHIIFGHPGIQRRHPDYYAVQVMNYILGGGGFASRLLAQIRDRYGLAYSAGSDFSTGLKGGTFQVSLGTQNATANRAMEVLFEELRRIRQQPVGEQELADAKAFLIGSFPLRLAETRDLASLFTTIELYDLGLDYIARFPALIQAVTGEDVQRVARAYVHPQQGVLVILADMEQAQVQY
jgi:zinc protease